MYKKDTTKANFDRYLADGLIKKTSPNRNITRILVQNATESLHEAQRTQSALWRIVMSYYAMFYIANAVLTSQGYKVGDAIAHKVTSDALVVVVKDKLTKTLITQYEDVKVQALQVIKSDEIIQSFEYERKKRSFFQYTTTEHAKQQKADTSLKRAQEFVFAMKKLL